MKKIITFLFFLLLFSQNVYSEVINLDCKLPSGNSYSSIIKLDTIKKVAADKFDFEKGSTKDIIKFVSFIEMGSEFKGVFFTVNLKENTILNQIVNNISKLNLRLNKNDVFKLAKGADEILLGCERINSEEKLIESNNLASDRSLIKENYYCKGVSSFNNLKIYNIELLENNNFSATIDIISEEKNTSIGKYHATFDRGNLFWFILEDRNLVAFQLLQEVDGKREFRYIAYPVTDLEFNKIKPLFDKTLNFVDMETYLKSEEKLYEVASKVLQRITMNNLQNIYGDNFSCDNNPNTILFAKDETSQSENLANYELELSNFEKNYLTGKGYNFDRNTGYFKTDFSNAMTTLGWNYFQGEDGFKINSEKSILWNGRASEWGHATASGNIGLFYYAGLMGLDQNLDKAHKFYTLAAKQWDTSPHEPSVILDEMNKFNPNPTNEFSNLRDLFFAAISLRSDQRMNNLVNLVDLSSIEIKKISIKEFLEKGIVYCEENNKITIHKKLSDKNLIIKDIYQASLTKDEEITNLKYAKLNNEKIEWYEITDGIPAYQIKPMLTKYSILFDKKIKKQLVYISDTNFITQKQFMKLRGPQAIALREKLASIGSINHIKFENKFFNSASEMFDKRQDTEDPPLLACE